MRRFTLGLLGLSLAACFQPTWRPIKAGDAIQPDSVILVGSFASDPPVQQHGIPRNCGGTWVNGRFEPQGKIIFVQETDGNVMAFFTPNLSEQWRSDALKPLETYDWTYMPVDGHFFVEIPRTRRVHLRGFTYLTNAGMRMFELPAQVDLSPKDRVVYVGEIHLHRNGTRRAEFRNGLEGARKAARERGLDGLLKGSWNVRLLRTTGAGPTLGDEWGDTCDGRKRL